MVAATQSRRCFKKCCKNIADAAAAAAKEGARYRHGCEPTDAKNALGEPQAPSSWKNEMHPEIKFAIIAVISRPSSLSFAATTTLNNEIFLPIFPGLQKKSSFINVAASGFKRKK